VFRIVLQNLAARQRFEHILQAYVLRNHLLVGGLRETDPFRAELRAYPRHLLM
jgi:hypothetical protein